MFHSATGSRAGGARCRRGLALPFRRCKNVSRGIVSRFFCPLCVKRSFFCTRSAVRFGGFGVLPCAHRGVAFVLSPFLARSWRFVARLDKIYCPEISARFRGVFSGVFWRCLSAIRSALLVAVADGGAGATKSILHAHLYYPTNLRKKFFTN